MEIVLATRNRKKVEELERMLRSVDVTVLSVDAFPACTDVVEDRDTFEGNATKKAVETALCSQRLSVADDSGLEVDALGGAPGVYSSRYAGECAGDEANIRRLLDEMKDVADGLRGARFVCCLALAFPEGNVVLFRGLAEGTIARESRGRSGFGYDPVFFPRGHARTFAEMSPDEKDALSHRRMALEQLKQYLTGLHEQEYK